VRAAAGKSTLILKGHTTWGAVSLYMGSAAPSKTALNLVAPNGPSRCMCDMEKDKLIFEHGIKDQRDYPLETGQGMGNVVRGFEMSSACRPAFRI
jgi:hypothetical protein